MYVQATLTLHLLTTLATPTLCPTTLSLTFMIIPFVLWPTEINQCLWEHEFGAVFWSLMGSKVGIQWKTVKLRGKGGQSPTSPSHLLDWWVAGLLCVNPMQVMALWVNNCTVCIVSRRWSFTLPPSFPHFLSWYFLSLRRGGVKVLFGSRPTAVAYFLHLGWSRVSCLPRHSWPREVSLIKACTCALKWQWMCWVWLLSVFLLNGKPQGGCSVMFTELGMVCTVGMVHWRFTTE